MTVYEYRLSFLHHDNGVSSIATVGEFGWRRHETSGIMHIASRIPVRAWEGERECYRSSRRTL